MNTFIECNKHKPKNSMTMQVEMRLSRFIFIGIQTKRDHVNSMKYFAHNNDYRCDSKVGSWIKVADSDIPIL